MRFALAINQSHLSQKLHAILYLRVTRYRRSYAERLVGKSTFFLRRILDNIIASQYRILSRQIVFSPLELPRTVTAIRYSLPSKSLK